MTDFKNLWELTKFLEVWPQEIRTALNEGNLLKGYHVFRTMDLEKNISSQSLHYTLPRAMSKQDHTYVTLSQTS